MSLVQWLPEIVRATDEDIARFGPNAAQVRALLDFIAGMGAKAGRVVENTVHRVGSREWSRAADAAWRAAGDASRAQDAYAAMNAAEGAATGAAWRATRYAAGPTATGEVVSDLIDPQTYRILTEPLNAGRVYDLRLPDTGSEFMRLVDKLRPATADDIERIADLSVDPRMPGIVELLQGLQGNMPLAAKIDAARRLDRASRTGRRLS